MQVANLLDKRFIGTDELRRNLTKILNNLSKTGDIVITQHGQPKAVLMDITTYQKIEQFIKRRTTQTYR